MTSESQCREQDKDVLPDDEDFLDDWVIVEDTVLPSTDEKRAKSENGQEVDTSRSVHACVEESESEVEESDSDTPMEFDEEEENENQNTKMFSWLKEFLLFVIVFGRFHLHFILVTKNLSDERVPDGKNDGCDEAHGDEDENDDGDENGNQTERAYQVILSQCLTGTLLALSLLLSLRLTVFTTNNSILDNLIAHFKIKFM